MNKFWKLTFKSIAVVVPIASGAATVVSCGKKAVDPGPFNNFKEKANEENAINIVKQLNITSWKTDGSEEFSKNGGKVGNNEITYIVYNNSKNEEIDVKATFHNQAYSLNDWTKLSDPHPSTETFDYFKKLADAESALDVIQKLNITSWKIDGSEIINKGAGVVGDKVVTYIIYNLTKHQQFSARATFHDQPYSINDWTKLSDPSDSKATFDLFLAQVKSQTDDQKVSAETSIWNSIVSAYKNSTKIANINIDFSHYVNDQLEVKSSSTITSDKVKQLITMNLVIGPHNYNQETDYMFTYNISLTLRWDQKSNYSKEYGYNNWTFNYSFNNWKDTLSTLFKEVAFKTWAVQRIVQNGIEWKYADSTVGNLVVGTDNATFTITNKNDSSVTINYKAQFNSIIKSGRTLYELFGDNSLENQWVSDSKTDPWLKYIIDARKQMSSSEDILAVLKNIHDSQGSALPTNWDTYIKDDPAPNFSAKANKPADKTSKTIFYQITCNKDNTTFDVKAIQTQNNDFSLNDFVPGNSNRVKFHAWFLSAEPILNQYEDIVERKLIKQFKKIVLANESKYPNYYDLLVNHYRSNIEQLAVKINITAGYIEQDYKINFSITIYNFGTKKKSVTKPAQASFQWKTGDGTKFDLDNSIENFNFIDTPGLVTNN